MHYLVTGGCGFIGSHLTEALAAQGHRVTVIDDLSTGRRERLAHGAALIEGDITTPGIFDDAVKHIDGCFHLAAIASVSRSQQDYRRAHEVNLGGTVALLDAIARRKRPIPFVLASSAAVYGDTPGSPLTESAHCKPISFYGVDKLGSELHTRIATASFGIPTAGLRFFNVFGPRQDPSSPYSGVITIFAERMKKHLPVTINGDGEQIRDFIYVGDIVRGLIIAMQGLEKKRFLHGIFNVCGGQGTSVNALAAAMKELTHSRSVIMHGRPREGDPRFSVGEASHAAQSLGFTAATSLAEGLTLTLESL